ncbi:MAG: 30S ribosomal protein S18 [bacterium]|nr:30S ribosomal protein S18 [bacterium]
MVLKTNEQRKSCFYCVNNKAAVDYKDIANLRRFVSSYMKIAPRRRSGLCAKHQRQVANAVKRSRQASLMSYMPK